MASMHDDQMQRELGVAMLRRIKHDKTGVEFMLPGGMTDDDLELLSILMGCFGIFKERNDERKGGFRTGGVKANAVYARGKAERIMAQAINGEVPNRDHAIDLINYAAFVLMCGDDLDGTWDWANEADDEVPCLCKYDRMLHNRVDNPQCEIHGDTDAR